MDVSLPYVENTLSELESGNHDLIDKHGQHMHWGYWVDARRPDVSAEGYKKAADEMAFQHFDMAKIRSGQKILDVGCGFGGTILLLNERHDNIDVTGLNIDPRQIEWAQKTVVPKARESNTIQFQAGDACELPYPDASFDRIYAIECIFHFPSRRKFLSEARRVLKPGGRLVFSDFVLFGPTAGLLAAIEPWYREDFKKVYGDSQPPWTRSVYYVMALASGFVVDEFRDVTTHALPTCQALALWQGPMTRAKLGASYDRANRYVEQSARLRMIRYQLYAFAKR
ncbi:MAG: methyltransferase domain-containing protein [Myxococcota bacterium]